MFEHLKKLEVRREALATVELPELAPKAQVIVRPATEANPLYFNAMMKRAGSRARRMVRTERITLEDAEQNRQEDRELFPRYVLVGWSGVLDSKNQPVPFNEDTAKEFCKALPSWLFDRIRNTAATPERFLDDGEPVPDPGTLAGN